MYLKILNFNRKIKKNNRDCTVISHKMKFYYYAAISIGGLLVSVLIFYLAHSLLRISAFYANWLGDIVALSIVFFCSWAFVFDHKKKKITLKFLLNFVSKLLVILILSTLLQLLNIYLDTSYLFQEFTYAQRDFLLALAKVLLAPVSLLVNYLITFTIIEKIYRD